MWLSRQAPITPLAGLTSSLFTIATQIFTHRAFLDYVGLEYLHWYTVGENLQSGTRRNVSKPKSQVLRPVGYPLSHECPLGWAMRPGRLNLQTGRFMGFICCAFVTKRCCCNRSFRWAALSSSAYSFWSAWQAWLHDERSEKWMRKTEHYILKPVLFHRRTALALDNLPNLQCLLVSTIATVSGLLLPFNSYSLTRSQVIGIPKGTSWAAKRWFTPPFRLDMHLHQPTTATKEVSLTPSTFRSLYS